MLAAVVAELYKVAGYQSKTQISNNDFDAYAGRTTGTTANVYHDLGAFRFTTRKPGRIVVCVMLFKSDGTTATVTLGASLDGGATVAGSSSSIGSFGSSDEVVTVDVPTPGEHRLMLRAQSSQTIGTGGIRVIAYAFQFMEAA